MKGEETFQCLQVQSFYPAETESFNSTYEVGFPLGHLCHLAHVNISIPPSVMDSSQL